MAEIRQIFEKLSGSVRVFSSLSYAAETGMLEHLSESRTIAYVSERTGVIAILVDRVFGILASLNLVQRQGETFTADKGLIPLVAAALGMNKAMIIVGHERSEEPGMKEMANWLRPLLGEIPVHFSDSREPFVYL